MQGVQHGVTALDLFSINLGTAVQQLQPLLYRIIVIGVHVWRT